MKENEIKKQVQTALAAAQDKKATDTAVLELGKESSAFTDYFVICSGSNPRQVQAISDEVEERLSKSGFEPNHREGYDLAEWVLLDYVDFVVHIFSENARKFYDLERLWKSAKRLTDSELKAAPVKKTARKTATSRKTSAKAPAKPAKKVAKKSARKTAVKRVSRPRKG